MKHFLLMESNDGTVTTFDGYVENWAEAKRVVSAFVDMLHSDSNKVYAVEEYQSSGVFLINLDCTEVYTVYVGVVPEKQLPLNSVSWTGFNYENA